MSKTPKFGPVILDFLTRKRRVRHLSEATLTTYDAMAKRLAPLAHRAVDTLRPADFEGLYADLLEDGLKPSSIAMVHRVANMVLNDAKANGIVQRNPCTGVDTPRMGPSAGQATKIDGPALTNLLAVADREGVPGLIVLVALAAGLRRGELTRLTRNDFDPAAGTLTVLKGKTASAKRTLALPPAIAAKLAAHLATVARPGTAPLFPARDGGRARPDVLYRRVKGVLSEAGLGDLTLHTLRHTHASVLLNAGVDEGVVARRLGHKDATVTRRIYDHAGVRDEAAAVAAIQTAMETSNAL